MNEISLLIKRLRPTPGNVMVWLVVVMLIFAILGVTMVSLFSTSISSTAVQNDTRRAVYLSESGIRFARSQLWAGDFSESTIEELNDPNKKYTLTGVGTFDIDLFSPWFDSKNSFDSSVDGNVIDLEMGEGVIPDGFDQVFPVGNEDLLLVNYDYLSPSLDPIEKLKPQNSAKAKIIAYTTDVSPAFKLTIEDGDGGADGFVAAKDEQVCLAALSFAGEQEIPTQGHLDLKPGAQAVFPHSGGAFEVKRKNFYYTGIDSSQTDRVRLSGVSLVANETGTVTVDADEPVIFSPRNLMILSEGKSGDVKFGKRLEYVSSIADTSVVAAKSRKPDIEFEEEENLTGVLSRIYDSSRYSTYMSVDEDEKTLRLGGTGPTFGAVWFKPLQPRSIGGQRNFCTSNGCLFGSGIRVFYTLEYSGTGEGLDGIVFALLNGNPQKNDASSAGGDGERSELLGFAGDSRLTSSPTKAEDFLDNSGPVIGSPVRGLRPPKIGLEFDNLVNRNDDFERTLEYCGSSTSLDVDTRNDPGEPATDNRDAVQYVFWANSTLDVPCRREPFCQSNPACLGDPSYDDNRHNAVSGVGAQTNWPFIAGGSIDNTPAIGPGPDFTVYFGIVNGPFGLYAVKPDGTLDWKYDTVGIVHTPTVSGAGSIYFGSGSSSVEGLFHGLNSNRSERFAPVTVSGRPDTKPVIDSDGTIYIGTNIHNSPTPVGRIYAFRPDGSLKPGWLPLNNPVQIPFTQVKSPALSPSGAKLIVASADGVIRGFNTSDGGIDFEKSIAGFSGSPSDPVVVSDGAGSYHIYIRDNTRVYKLDANGDRIWTSPSLPRSGTLSTAPAVGPSNSVYVGAFDGYLYAVSTADGTKKWDYKHPQAFNGIQSTPVIDGNGHIYFGTDHNYVYALTDRATEAGLKWRYQVESGVKSSPAVKNDGTVYAGTSGFRLHAINQFDGPKNYKDRLITSYPGSPFKVGGTSEASREGVVLQDEEDWLKGIAGKRQWAVRMEVTRSQTAAADGSFEYTLETWIRQCNLVDCGDVVGSFYGDTRIDYAPAEHPVQLQQTVKLGSDDHGDFQRFLFGFTAATASAESQTANIRKFQLSFIRPNDPVIDSDPWNP